MSFFFFWRKNDNSSSKPRERRVRIKEEDINSWRKEKDDIKLRREYQVKAALLQQNLINISTLTTMAKACDKKRRLENKLDNEYSRNFRNLNEKY